MSHSIPLSTRVTAADIGRYEGQRVQVAGWIHRVRHLGGLTFLLVRDRSGVVQVVLEAAPTIATLSVETVVAIEGQVVEEPRAPRGWELRCRALEVLAASEPVPLAVNLPDLRAAMDIQLNHRALSLRHRKNQAIFAIQACLVSAFRSWLSGRGFMEVRSPKIVASGTEGGAELFPLDYFGRTAYLAQSPQFYKQMLVGAGFERVFEVGPVFRAEEHNTARHLNEYTSLDVEMGFIQDEGDLLALEEGLLSAMLQAVAAHCGEGLELLGATVPEVGHIPVYTFAEALELLAKDKERAGGGLSPQDERALGELVREKHGSELVFVTRYPAAKRPMYALPCSDEPSVTHSFDLLFRGMEITTGGQRIHDQAMLVERVRSRGLDPQAFAFYIEPFRYGFPPHGGFAIGLERLTAQLCGLTNVRMATLFPRDRQRLVP